MGVQAQADVEHFEDEDIGDRELIMTGMSERERERETRREREISRKLALIQT